MSKIGLHVTNVPCILQIVGASSETRPIVVASTAEKLSDWISFSLSLTHVKSGVASTA